MEKNSQAYCLFAVVSMCGECSEKAVELLLPEHKSRWKILNALTKENRLTLFQKNDLRGYRITKSGKKWILQWEEKRFAFFLAEGADFSMRRSSLVHRWRQHRISEVCMMMLKNDMLIYADEKPAVFAAEPPQSVKIRQSVFYSVREVKEQTMLTRKIGSSRICGVWLQQKQLWFCYNAGEHLPKWLDNVEDRAGILIPAMLRKCGLQYDSVNAVLFGYRMEQAAVCLQDPKTRVFLMNGPFQRICFVPLDDTGSFLLRLLEDQETYQALQTVLKEDLHETNSDWQIENDGYNQDGDPVLILLDFDMKRLFRFEYQLRSAEKQGEVICFDFQEEAVREFCGDRIEVSVVILKAVQEYFFPEL